MSVSKFLLVVFVTSALFAEDVKTVPCFTVNEARPVQRKGRQALQADHQSFKKISAGGVEFHARGQASSQAVWHIPLGYNMPVRYDVSFTVQTQNIKAPGNRPNIYILLAPTTTTSKLLPRKVPLFTSGGVDGKELGSTQFSNPAGYTVNSLVVDLSLVSDGNATLQLLSCDIEHESNLPADAVLKRQQRMWRGMDAAFDTKPVASIRIGKASYPCDGVAMGANPQPAILKRLAPAKAFHFNHVRLPLSGTDSLWEMPGYFNTKRLGDLVKRAASPGTALVLNVDLSAPPVWWTKQAKQPAQRLHSDFNARWVNYCREALGLLIAGLAAEGLDKHVAAMILDVSPDKNAVPLPDRLRDPDLTSSFRQWLNDQYFDAKALKLAWNQPDVTFNSAQWVPVKQWPRGLIGQLGTTPTGRVADSIRFYSESWDTFNLGLNTLIKELTRNKCLTGIWLPANRHSLLWDNQYYRIQGVERVIEEEAVDFVELPDWEPDFLPAIPFRTQKPVIARFNLNGYKTSTALREALRLVYCSSNRLDGVVFETDRLISLAGKTVGDDLKQLRLVRKQNRVSTTGAELAFVIDPGFLEGLSPLASLPIATGTVATDDPMRRGKRPAPMHYLYETARKLWPYTGMPYDIVSIDTLNPEMDYRVLVFFHCVRMTPDRVKRIDALKKKGRTMVWSWADAIMADNAFAASSAKAITGINIKLSSRPQRLFMLPTAEMSDFLGGHRLETTPGGIVSPYEANLAERQAFAPSFEINDPKVDVLATHIDTGRPALGIREFFRWNAMYSCSPAINPEIIRAAALKSDAHVYYYQDNPFRLNDTFIVIYARTTGVHSLEFDEKTPLYEVFSGLELKPSDSHRFNVMKGKTYLFYRGEKSGWLTMLSNQIEAGR